MLTSLTKKTKMHSKEVITWPKKDAEAKAVRVVAKVVKEAASNG